MAVPRRPSGGGLRRAPQDGRLEEINKEFLCDPKFSDEEDLEEKLAVFKEKYMEFDLNNQGEIGECLGGAGLEEQQPDEEVSAASLCTHVSEEENLWAFPISCLAWILTACQGHPWLSSPCLSASSVFPPLLQHLNSSHSSSPPESLLNSSTSSPIFPTNPFVSILSISRAGKLLGFGQSWVLSGLRQKLYKTLNTSNAEELFALLGDLMSVKRMMEKMGAPKTHLELKKMISEVTGGVSETISYQDFVNVMLGKRSAVLKLVMMFEGKANESNPKPSGPPPERDIASLP